MDIKLDKKNSIEGSIKINLKASDYQPKVDEKIKEYARKANIKGFRQGKVPTGVISKMYGKSIKVEEINHMLSHALSDYIKDNDIQILGEPIPELDRIKDIDWENQSEFDFEYSIGIVDEFSYDLTKKNKVKRLMINPDAKTEKSTLEDIQKQHGKVTNPEQSEAGDALYGTFKLDDIENDALIEMSDIEKKSQKIFAGAKEGSEIRFDLKIVENEVAIARYFKITPEEAKTIKGKVSLTVKNINRNVPSELDQELFDKVFGKDTVKTATEFKAKIKSTVQENYGRESDLLLDRDIKDALVAKTKIKTPDDFLKRWLLLSNKGEITESDIEKDYEQYLKDLKWSLISNDIFKKQEIKVENDDVIAEARKQIIGQLGGPAVADVYKDQLEGIVQNFLKADKGKNYMNIFNQIKDRRILDVIKEKISITDKKVNLDEFKKLAEA